MNSCYSIRVLSRPVNQYRRVICGKLIQQESVVEVKKMSFNYPSVRRDENAFDNYHGQKVIYTSRLSRSGSNFFLNLEKTFFIVI